MTGFTGVTVCLQRLISATVERFGQIDCLVNNAGWRESRSSSSCRQVWRWRREGVWWFFLFPLTDPPHNPTDDITAEEFRELLNLNLISYFLASKVTFPASVQPSNLKRQMISTEAKKGHKSWYFRHLKSSRLNCFSLDSAQLCNIYHKYSVCSISDSFIYRSKNSSRVKTSAAQINDIQKLNLKYIYIYI